MTPAQHQQALGKIFENFWSVRKMPTKKRVVGGKAFDSLLTALGQVPKAELDAEIRKYEAARKRRKAKRQGGNKG